MASPSVTYTFSNATSADATQVNQNFTDLINSLTDGTKDLSISAITCAGNATFNGNTTIGSASSDDVTFNAALASTIPIKTHNSYDIGSVTSKGLRAIYFASSSATNTAKVQGPAISSDITLTLPARTGTLGLYVAPTIQILTSTSSSTYTTATGVKHIRVRMVGGGGGGGGAGISGASAGGDGGNTTFGSSLLTANGGTGGAYQTAGAAGGSVTVNSPAVDIASRAGAPGGGSGYLGAGSGIALPGGSGASTPFGGGAGGGPAGNVATFTGKDAVAYTGAGGGGGGQSVDSNVNYSSGGGGAGGYIEAFIANPSATYSYQCGAGGTAGTAGASNSGGAGGVGGSGVIVVEEYY